MRKYYVVRGIHYRSYLIVVIFLFLFPTNGVLNTRGNQLQTTNNLLFDPEPVLINFWRANPKIYPIIESHIFPIASLGADGSLANLGTAWITWTIEIQNKKIAAWAIFDKGAVRNYTLLDGYYDEVYWHWAQQELFLITSHNRRTDFYWYSTGEKPLIDHYSMQFNSTNHNMLVSETDFLVFLYQNGTTPTNIRIEGFSPSITVTNETLISSNLGMGLFQLPDQSIELRTSSGNSIIPSEFSNRSVIGHSMLNPTVFDINSSKVWSQINPDLIDDLPEDAETIYPLGLRSSIVRTTSNTLFEYSLLGWEEIATYNSSIDIQDYSIIDIDLYMGTTVGKGLLLLTSGKDEDADYIPDTMEDYYTTFPENPDSDNDKIPDGLEIAFGTNPLFDDLYYDYDGDGLNNLEEYQSGTDPNYHDSDYGGAIDGWEVKYKFDPLNASDDLFDNDDDGVSNRVESLWDSNPNSTDSDSDGMPDGWEIKYQLDPTDPLNADIDYDDDGWSNYEEFKRNSDPLIPDPRSLFDGLLFWFFTAFIGIIPVTILIWKKVIPEIDS
ncbi:MAG: hypothetical protein ACXAD7_00225 [Candidatus Kariarchaeaceae archaeon]|jgi:hypothetical protein